MPATKKASKRSSPATKKTAKGGKRPGDVLGLGGANPPRQPKKSAKRSTKRRKSLQPQPSASKRRRTGGLPPARVRG